MAKAASARDGRKPPEGWVDPLRPQQPLASTRWIAGAIIATLLFAAVCVYLTICGLFWQGQWQFLFHPSRAITTTPATLGLAFSDVRFDATETGVLQLDGWWVPADVGGAFAHQTILMLRDGSGSLSDSAAQIEALHAIGINVFAFDYRGFGKSVDLHPSERTTTEDAEAAWQYLTATRHIDGHVIAIFGDGLGGAVATEIARRHPEAFALLFQNLKPPAIDLYRRDPHANFLPLSLLVHDRFDPAPTLDHLRTPKLFLSSDPQPRFFADAAAPKEQFVARPPLSADPQYGQAIASFLRRYGHKP